MMASAKSTSEFFHNYAEDFDAIYGRPDHLINRLFNHLFRRSMRLRFHKTIEGCLPADGKTALDVGCGPGHYGVALARLGMKEAWGIDFAPAMIERARKKAETAGVADRCRFILDDFNTHTFDRRFDFCIVTGFMDYAADPAAVIGKVLALTTEKTFFSFPAAGGFLAWQRRIRYRQRCDLYLYRRAEIEKLFSGRPVCRVMIERISRDYFVTVEMK